MPIATNLGRMLTNLEGLLSILLNLLVMWSCKIMLQIKTIISPLPWCWWQPNMAGLWLIMRGSHPQSHWTFWWCGFARSLDKLKTYLHYHNTHSHKTLQDGDLTLQLLPIEPHIMAQSCKIMWQTKILWLTKITPTLPMTTKLDRAEITMRSFLP